MQKKLIALAVAGLASGAAYAQTNVTIYGAADATFEVVQAKDASIGNDILRYNRVASNSSILGFRGSEDLGGGLKAIFQFEGGVSLDQNTTLGFSRDTFVGLQGGFGQVKAGLITGPARSLGAAVDLTVGATGIGANTAMLGKLGGNVSAGGLGTGEAFSYWDTRRANSVQYVTPKFGGFEVRAMYGAGEVRPQGTKAAATYEIGGFYSNGPWYAGLTYGQAKPNTAGYLTSNGMYGEKMTNIRLAGTYTFQAGHKISALFEQNKATDVTLIPAGQADVKSYTWGLGGKFKVSQPGAIIAQFYQVTKLKGMDDANDFKANLLAIGYEHSLSKRTTVKAYYSRISNKDNAGYNYGIGNIAGARPGSDPTGISVGVRHSF
ncbi:MAG: porin [Candidatus Accumulibacter sp.]|jgi:predicted porin|nr:porin [Accumulibacter sp.]